MGAKITKSKYLRLLQTLGENVGENIRAAVPARQIITPLGVTQAQAARMVGSTPVTREQMTQACAVTAGIVVGCMFDVLGFEIVDDESEQGNP